MNDFEYTLNKYLEIAARYKELYQKAKSKFPYRMNIIDELHDNENAHSRILLQLLRYVDNGKYSILESFVRSMKELCEENVDIVIKSPQITGQYEFIDGLIFEDGKYAIVIENKIWGAVDQYEQIKRYVESASKHVEKRRIYVIYLTMDGSKTVSESSLPVETQKELGGRFIPMSYKYDIIPWLKEDVAPNCKVKEEYLRSAIHQYVDYLEEINGMHNYQQKVRKEILAQIFPSMNSSKLDQYNVLSENLRTLNELTKKLLQEKQEMEKGVLKNFTRYNKETFNELYGDDVCVVCDHAHDGWYQVRKRSWNSHIHLEWIPFNGGLFFEEEAVYTLVLHVEGNCYKKYSDTLNSNEKLALINDNRKNNRSRQTFYSNSFSAKGLGMMGEVEMRKFLYGIYASEDIRTIVMIVDEMIENC